MLQAGRPSRRRYRSRRPRRSSKRGAPQVASAVTPQEVDTLPLNGRNYLDLALLAPNVSRTNLRSTDRFAETSAVPGHRRLGRRTAQSRATASSSTACRRTTTPRISPGHSSARKSIREFQVVTSGGVAEFGRASSGTVSVVTKSGDQPPVGPRLRVLPRRRLRCAQPAVDPADPRPTRR